MICETRNHFPHDRLPLYNSEGHWMLLFSFPSSVTHPLPGLSVLADEERELAVRRCESALSRVVARQEGVRDLPELRDMDELIQSVETVETATSSSAFARAFEPSADVGHGIHF